MNERRKGADFWSKLMITLNIIAWLAVLVIAVMMYYAQPEMQTGAMRYKGIQVRDYWQEWLPLIRPVVTATTLMVLVAILINLKRMKRKQDRLHRNYFLLIALLSIFAWVVFTV